MKILHLTPGTGTFHCGSCLRDNALIKALRTRGHDAMMSPLYLPLVTDADEANPEQPVRVGGISLFLQEKAPRLFGLMPGMVRRFLDDPERLRWASKFIGMTSPKDLGVMTVGSLLGENGRQWQEWERLVQWIESEVKPEAISLSNSLLIGLAPAMARRLGVPIVVSLQGEDSFLDTLPEPYRAQAWDLMQQNAQHVSRFIAPSKFYADALSPRLGVDASKMAILFNGLNFDQYAQERQEPAQPTIGYLARMIHGKGLTTLVDAFILLSQRGTVPGVRLRVAGAHTPADEPYIETLRDKLGAAGLLGQVTFEPNVSFADKITFLHQITVFSVPATYGEAFGLYLAEAQACGAPAVQPRHGAFPEILSVTQGGTLCEPDDPASLAQHLEELLTNHTKRQQLSERAKYSARAHFSASRMAERFEHVLTHL